MYRVELKDPTLRARGGAWQKQFLMYRVELKVISLKSFSIAHLLFLMYRVELKVLEEALI